MNKDTLINAMEKFKSNLMGLSEIDLIILRGHLLLEEYLYNAICEFVFHPTFIKKADMSFSQMVSIARSISLDEENNSVWGLILAINKLRNKIAHELPTSVRIKEYVAKVKDLYNGEMNGVEDAQERMWKNDDCKGMTFAVAMGMGFLNEFLEEVKRFKKAVHLIDTIYNPHRHNN